MLGFDRRKISVLQKCLLAALLVHIALLSSFKFLPVAGGLVTYVSREIGLVDPGFDLTPKLESEVRVAVRRQSHTEGPVAAESGGRLIRQSAAEIGDLPAMPGFSMRDLSMSVPQATIDRQAIAVLPPILEVPQPPTFAPIGPTPAISPGLAISPPTFELKFDVQPPAALTDPALPPVAPPASIAPAEAMELPRPALPPTAMESLPPVAGSRTGGLADSLVSVPGASPEVVRSLPVTVVGEGPLPSPTDLLTPMELSPPPMPAKPLEVVIAGGDPASAIAGPDVVPGLARQDVATDSLAGGAGAALITLDTKSNPPAAASLAEVPSIRPPAAAIDPTIPNPIASPPAEIWAIAPLPFVPSPIAMPPAAIRSADASAALPDLSPAAPASEKVETLASPVVRPSTIFDLPLPKPPVASSPSPANDASASNGPAVSDTLLSPNPIAVMPPMALATADVRLTPTVAVAPPKLDTAPQVMPQRAAEQRRPAIEKLGGTRESEKAVDRGLAYLARMQEPDGRWSFVEESTEKAAPGQRRPHEHDMALTGLAVLAFLAADHSPVKDGPYREAVGRGIQWIIAQQALDGDLRGAKAFRGSGSNRANLYDHGIATMAVAEAAWITGDQRAIEAAFGAARFICRAQSQRTGGWRYAPGEAGDTSVFGWQILALHQCEQLGFQTPPEVRTRAIKYMSQVSSGPHRMLAGYTAGEGPTPPMTAESLLCRILLGQPVTGDGAKEVSDFLTRDFPKAGKTDLYYWYYASLSLSQMQNNPQVRQTWDRWNERCRDTLIATQAKGGRGDGSWTDSRWGPHGGKVFSTALATLTLEVYYRYLPFQPGDPNAEAQWKAAEPENKAKPRGPLKPKFDAN